MSTTRLLFATYGPHNWIVQMGNSTTATAVRVWTIDHPIRIGSALRTTQVSDVLHIPQFQWQVLSVPKIASLVEEVSSTQSTCSFILNSVTVTTGNLQCSLYLLTTIPSLPSSLSNQLFTSPSLLSPSFTLPSHNYAHVLGLRLWHDCLCHVEPSTISSIVNNKVLAGITLHSSSNSWVPCSGRQLVNGSHLSLPTQSSGPPSHALL